MKMKNVGQNILLSCVVAFSMSLTSCIKDADSETAPSQASTEENGSIRVDSTFVALEARFIGEWYGEYQGYDPKQEKVSAIRRMVRFLPDGTYESHVQGILDKTEDIEDYKEFEHERGTFSFDEGKQMMVYTVEYDSLLNFETEKMEHHAGKLRMDIELPQYGERVYFSKEKEGKRDWVRTDDNLFVEENHDIQLIYVMKNQ